MAVLYNMDACPPFAGGGPPGPQGLQGPPGPPGPAGVGPPTTNTLTLTAGWLTTTVNGVVATVPLGGERIEDAFGTGIGYLLPL